MRTPLPCLLVAAVAAATGVIHAPCAAGAEPIAVVASVKGRVEIATARGGDAVPAAFGRALERGDKVTVGKGGVATLFFGDGNVITLAERSSLTIGGRAGAAPRAGALPGDVFAHVSRFATAGSRQTGLVSLADMRAEPGAGAPLLLAPRNTAVLDEAPTLSWRAVPEAAVYRVRVGPSGGTELWVREVAAPGGTEASLPYPADAPRLRPGVDYEWEVELLGADGTLSRESARMTLLPEDERAGARANLARILATAGGEQDPAARYLAGSYLSGLGLFDDAAREFRALVSLAPESPAPHEALGNLYLGVGMTDWAAAEFRRALALQKDAR